MLTRSGAKELPWIGKELEMRIENDILERVERLEAITLELSKQVISLSNAVYDLKMVGDVSPQVLEDVLESVEREV